MCGKIRNKCLLRDNELKKIKIIKLSLKYSREYYRNIEI